MNQVSLTGRLTKDPEIKHLGNGSAVVNFIIAVDKGLSKEKKKEYESKNMPTADFVKIVAWGNLAENCFKYTNKGSLIGVNGRIQTGSYDDKDGKRVFTTDVVATTVDFLNLDDSKDRRDYSDMHHGFSPSDIMFE